jgi:hypothetical protein
MSVLPLKRGIYYFENEPGVSKPGVLIQFWDFSNNKDSIATVAPKWPWDNTVPPNSSNILLSLWLVEPLKAYRSTAYTIRNLGSGNYLACRNRYKVVVDKLRNNAGERWTVTPHPSRGYYRIMNMQYGTSLGGQFSNYNYSVLGQGSAERWGISKPLSCSGADIDKALTKSLPRPISGLPPPVFRRLKAYNSSAIYLIPSRGIFEEIRKAINQTGYRKELFDCDDFTFGFKAAVAAWFNDKIAVAGIPIFCGMMFEHYLDANDQVVSGHAYNFLLSNDHSRLEYFEPQNGKQPVMNKKFAKGYCYLALC